MGDDHGPKISVGLFASGVKTLAEIERQFQEQGYPQDEIDAALAEIVTMREMLAARGGHQRPVKPS